MLAKGFRASAAVCAAEVAHSFRLLPPTLAMSGADPSEQLDAVMAYAAERGIDPSELGLDPSTLTDDDIDMEPPEEIIKRAREALGAQGWQPQPLDSSMVAGDAALPADAQHLHQPPEPFGLTFPEEIPPTLYETQVRLFGEFQKIGMEISVREDTTLQPWMPDPNSDDYKTNHQQLARFWGVVISSTLQDQDLRKRRRLVLLLVHLDKVSSLPADSQSWCTTLTRDILNSFREVSETVARYRTKEVREPSNSFGNFTFQELPERFQLWCSRPEGLHCNMAVLNTSETFYWSTLCRPPQGVPVQSVAPDSCAVFLENFAYSSEDDITLEALLCSLIGCSNFDSFVDTEYRVGIALQKAPHTLWKWLDWQMAILRSKNIKLELYLLLFVDAFPCLASKVPKFFNHGLFQHRNMGHFRLPSIFVDPPMMTVITAGLGHMKTLKRVAVARFTTAYQPLAPSGSSTLSHFYKRWIDDVIPEFTSSVKLFVDFPAPDLIHAVAGFQQVAVKFGAHMESSATRSLGDSGRAKRCTLTLSFDPHL